MWRMKMKEVVISRSDLENKACRGRQIHQNDRREVAPSMFLQPASVLAFLHSLEFHRRPPHLRVSLHMNILLFSPHEHLVVA